MKTAAKRLIGHALNCVTAKDEGALAVLTYHSIGGNAPGSQSVARFREQMAWLSSHADKFPVMPLRGLFSGSAVPNRGTRVLVTLDDGYRDNAELAAPTLEEFGCRAVFFVSTAFIDGDRGIVDNFRNYRGLPNMTWEQVAGLAERGHEIGLHGHRHPNYALLSHAEAEEDMERSLELLRARIGYVPVSFAYPFGQPHHCRTDLEATYRRCGIKYVFTTLHKRASVYGRANDEASPRQMPRLRVDPGDSVEILVEKLRGLWDWIGAVQAWRSSLQGRRGRTR